MPDERTLDCILTWWFLRVFDQKGPCLPYTLWDVRDSNTSWQAATWHSKRAKASTIRTSYLSTRDCQLSCLGDFSVHYRDAAGKSGEMLMVPSTHIWVKFLNADISFALLTAPRLTPTTPVGFPFISSTLLPQRNPSSKFPCICVGCFSYRLLARLHVYADTFAIDPESSRCTLRATFRATMLWKGGIPSSNISCRDVGLICQSWYEIPVSVQAQTY